MNNSKIFKIVSAISVLVLGILYIFVFVNNSDAVILKILMSIYGAVLILTGITLNVISLQTNVYRKMVVEGKNKIYFVMMIFLSVFAALIYLNSFILIFLEYFVKSLAIKFGYLTIVTVSVVLAFTPALTIFIKSRSHDYDKLNEMDCKNESV